ncbi:MULTISPECIES: 2Fe-2S iron-sulfur cluster-binding protein [Paraburkholderia]|uniref:2Fe-2S iron-sulfur cluster binding domain-containing protein n=1 Tax=Paraburkholderia dipogonis TaxID=1211383 RepID=A0A4Y8MHA6_9BURK|nr:MULTISPECIES: 2Fe-2S iron-sulfur cluster-binding protein [Paraburkholderia]RKR31249.1 CDP-4-dehydro-6-deoxyglucose reductase [Paraburkholderia sp. BL17N1]TFE36773.1 2Fe-2S iron-sulfur cluster binding domain-containing protein [Paraburkholderia dipogonis]
MNYRISIAGSDVAFRCEADETLLDAAERSGYSVPYSCRKGVCSTCEGGVLAGAGRSTVQGEVQGPAERVLLCCLRPSSDMTIAPRKIGKREPVMRKTLDMSVYRITQPAADVSVVQLRLPTGVRAKFRAGQYLQIELEDGSRRNYSMANPPHESDSVQLHVRHVPGGKFSEGMLGGLDKGQTLRVELPFGEFTLQDDSTSPAILLATGTGFAPVKSIVEDAIKRKLARPLYLYWGARREEDLYLAELAQKWHASGKLNFVPVLSEPHESWTGRRGFVHETVLEDFGSLVGYQVYACGNPAMTSAAHDTFVEAGLPEADFFSDAFVHTDTRP